MKHKLKYHHPKNHIYRISYGDVTIGVVRKTEDGTFTSKTTVLFDEKDVSVKAKTMKSLLKKMTDAMSLTFERLDGQTITEAREDMSIPKVLGDALKF